jgi:uncharacterized protein YcbK (DUF882 family)
VEITELNFDGPEPENDSFTIVVDGPPWAVPVPIQAVAKREGDSDVILMEDSVGEGPQEIAFLAQGETPPEGVYFQIIVNVVGVMPPPEPAQATINRTECSDARTRIIREYRTRNTDWTPACADFVTVMNSTYFVTNEYNHNGYHTNFIARQTLTVGADASRSTYGSPLVTTAGYRCPDKQNDINANAVHGSRHHHGDAMDWASYNDQNIWTLIRAAAKANGACVEPSNLSTLNHVHADWRGTCPNANW